MFSDAKTCKLNSASKSQFAKLCKEHGGQSPHILGFGSKFCKEVSLFFDCFNLKYTAYSSISGETSDLQRIFDRVAKRKFSLLSENRALSLQLLASHFPKLSWLDLV